jgi:hypothetical protein
MKVNFSNTTHRLPKLKTSRSSGESSLGVPGLNPVQLRQLSARQELLRHPRDIFDENSKNYNPESPLARHAVIPPQQMTLPQLNARLVEAEKLAKRGKSALEEYTLATKVHFLIPLNEEESKNRAAKALIYFQPFVKVCNPTDTTLPKIEKPTMVIILDTIKSLLTIQDKLNLKIDQLQQEINKREKDRKLPDSKNCKIN